MNYSKYDAPAGYPGSLNSYRSENPSPYDQEPKVDSTSTMYGELDGLEKRAYSIKLLAEKTLGSLFGDEMCSLDTKLAGQDVTTFAKRLSALYNILLDVEATLDRVNSKIGGR